jgi:hypothetical protein
MLVVNQLPRLNTGLFGHVRLLLGYMTDIYFAGISIPRRTGRMAPVNGHTSRVNWNYCDHTTRQRSHSMGSPISPGGQA